MSFDVFVVFFREGEPSGIVEEDIRAAFGPVLRDDPQFPCWRATYGAEIDHSDIYLSRDEQDLSKITSFMVNRPVADSRLWESLYQIMLLGNVVLFFPGCRRPLVAHRDVVAHLPQEMIESLGEPEVIEKADDIVAAIKTA